jgi:hypothetical protein
MSVVSSYDVADWIDDPANNCLPKNPYLVEWWETGSEGGLWELSLLELAAYGIQYTQRGDPDRWGDGDIITAAHVLDVTDQGHLIGGDMEFNNTDGCASFRLAESVFTPIFHDWMREIETQSRDPFGYGITMRSSNNNCHATSPIVRDMILAHPDMTYSDGGGGVAGITLYSEYNAALSSKGSIDEFGSIAADSTRDLAFYNYANRETSEIAYEKILLDPYINKSAKLDSTNLVFDTRKLYIDFDWDEEYTANRFPDEGEYTWGVTSGATMTAYNQTGFDNKLYQRTTGAQTASYRSFTKAVTGTSVYAETSMLSSVGPDAGVIESGTSEAFMMVSTKTHITQPRSIKNIQNQRVYIHPD